MHDHTLSVLHIPKTGGTTLLAHFKKHWGEERTLLWGPFARVQWFFDGVPQIEERSPGQLRNIRVVLGHGVDQDVFTALDIPIRLMTVLRQPVARYRSQYDHRSRHMERLGVTIDSATFVEETSNGGFSAASILLKNFPDFVDRLATTEYAKTESVLRKFDYVLTTEGLDAQARSIMPHWNLPADLERKRVATDKRILDRDDAWIAAACPVDRRLHEAASKACAAGPAGYNAFGFDEAGKDARSALRKGYNQLAKILCQELRAPAALHKLENDDALHVKEPDLLRQLLVDGWARRRETCNPKQLEVAQDLLAKQKRRSRTRPAPTPSSPKSLWKKIFRLGHP